MSISMIGKTRIDQNTKTTGRIDGMIGATLLTKAIGTRTKDPSITKTVS